MPRHLSLALRVSAFVLTLIASIGPALAQDPARAARRTAEADLRLTAGEAPGSHGGQHEGAAEPNILEPQPKLAVWTLVVFLLLLAVLWKFAWGPLANALHHREEHLERVLLDTERARNESEQLLAEYRRQLAEAAEKAREIIDTARRDAQAVADELAKKAQAEAEATRDRAQRDIESARDQALMEIWNTSANLAVTVAGRVLDKELTPDDHRRLLERAIAELPSAPHFANGEGARLA